MASETSRHGEDSGSGSGAYLRAAQAAAAYSTIIALFQGMVATVEFAGAPPLFSAKGWTVWLIGAGLGALAVLILWIGIIMTARIQDRGLRHAPATPAAVLFLTNALCAVFAESWTIAHGTSQTNPSVVDPPADHPLAGAPAAALKAFAVARWNSALTLIAVLSTTSLLVTWGFFSLGRTIHRHASASGGGGAK